MRSAIADLGWIPRRRNVFYELFDEDDAPSAADASLEKAQGLQLPVLAATP
jgi:hypothetical protein